MSTRSTKQYHIFLSHNNSDKASVEKIAGRLEDEAGLKPFLDKWHLVPGEPWQDALEMALDCSETCAVFVGPAGLGPWENEEMRSALDERVKDKTLRVIPVLLPGANPTDNKTLPRFLRRLAWVDFSPGIDDEEAFRNLVAGIKGQAPGRVKGRAAKRNDNRKYPNKTVTSQQNVLNAAKTEITAESDSESQNAWMKEPNKADKRKFKPWLAVTLNCVLPGYGLGFAYLRKWRWMIASIIIYSISYLAGYYMGTHIDAEAELDNIIVISLLIADIILKTGSCLAAFLFANQLNGVPSINIQSTFSDALASISVKDVLNTGLVVLSIIVSTIGMYIGMYISYKAFATQSEEPAIIVQLVDATSSNLYPMKDGGNYDFKKTCFDDGYCDYEVPLSAVNSSKKLAEGLNLNLSIEGGELLTPQGWSRYSRGGRPFWSTTIEKISPGAAVFLQQLKFKSKSDVSQAKIYYEAIPTNGLPRSGSFIINLQ